MPERLIRGKPGDVGAIAHRRKAAAEGRIKIFAPQRSLRRAIACQHVEMFPLHRCSLVPDVRRLPLGNGKK